MAIVKSKVTECKPTGKDPDKYGNKSYNIIFENGDKGLYIGKDPGYFDVGKEATYNIEAKVSRNNVTWSKISKPQKEDTGGGGFSKKNDPATQYRIQRTVALKAAIQVGIYAPFEIPKTSDLADKFLAFIVERTKTDGDGIAAQSAIAQAVEIIQDHSKNVDNIEKVLKFAEVLFQYIIKPMEAPAE